MSPIETLLGQHHANVGPITGKWTCACGTQSINGSIHTDDKTSLEERRAQYRAHLADVLHNEGLVETEWAVINNGLIIHIADATCPADVMRATHGHGTHGPVGVARRTVTRSPWQHLEGGPS